MINFYLDRSARPSVDDLCTAVLLYFTQQLYETRETPAFGGNSLALRGSGAFGGGEREKKKKKFGAPAYAAFGGGKKKYKIRAPPVPQMVLKT